MLVRFMGGPLGGLELLTDDSPWLGGWFTIGDEEWALYIPTHEEPGVVLADRQPTRPEPAQS
ncbi:hypothetical protein [Streptomyces sp. NPDC058595]|uniref:hypothetical protein n=1 Tax=Streptomyces sp. NPDC058595 TaxID=3346550 RepID=UPI00365D30B3